MIRYDEIFSKVVYAERKVKFDKFSDVNEFLLGKIKTVKLDKSINYPFHFYENVVREFYANLTEDVFDERNPRHGKVFIRVRRLLFVLLL